MAAKKSSTGMSKNLSAALSYVLGPVTGVIFLVIEKDSFVRFHAAQSIVVLGGLFAIQVLMFITIILAVFVPLVSLVGFALWLWLIFQAYQGNKWQVPAVGGIVESLLKKV